MRGIVPSDGCANTCACNVSLARGTAPGPWREGSAAVSWLHSRMQSRPSCSSSRPGPRPPPARFSTRFDRKAVALRFWRRRPRSASSDGHRGARPSRPRDGRRAEPCLPKSRPGGPLERVGHGRDIGTTSARGPKRAERAWRARGAESHAPTFGRSAGCSTNPSTACVRPGTHAAEGSTACDARRPGRASSALRARRGGGSASLRAASATSARAASRGPATRPGVTPAAPPGSRARTSRVRAAA